MIRSKEIYWFLKVASSKGCCGYNLKGHEKFYSHPDDDGEAKEGDACRHEERRNADENVVNAIHVAADKVGDWKIFESKLFSSETLKCSWKSLETIQSLSIGLIKAHTICCSSLLIPQWTVSMQW